MGTAYTSIIDLSLSIFPSKLLLSVSSKSQAFSVAIEFDRISKSSVLIFYFSNQMHSRNLACFNFGCKDEVCSELKLAHLVVFIKVLIAMFLFLPATYLRMRTMIAKSTQMKQVYSSLC